ncbi:TIGR00156 family protein [Campylobacterota bacterium]|nr:TIGR00156 family protein [Campylobacterota bacterium]
MKNLRAGVLCLFFAVLSVSSVYGQGFTGPGATANTSKVQTVTVVQAKGLSDNSLVTLTGTIVQSLGHEKYTFRDSTGDITVEIDRDLWTLLGVSIGTNDRVEIRGEIDIENRVAEIDVKFIKKL